MIICKVFEISLELALLLASGRRGAKSVQKIAKRRLGNRTFEWDWLQQYFWMGLIELWKSAKYHVFFIFSWPLSWALFAMRKTMMSEPGATVLVTATSNGSMMSRSSKSSSRCYLYPTHTWCLKHTQFYISQDQECVFLEMLWFPAPSRGWLLWSQSAGCLQSTRAKVFILKLHSCL